MNATRFVETLKAMMKYRRRPLYVVLDDLPAHRAKMVAEYVQGCGGMLELHFLPGYAPDLNPDAFVWNYVKKEGPNKKPLAKGASLRTRTTSMLERLKKTPALVRSFFRAPSVDYF